MFLNPNVKPGEILGETPQYHGPIFDVVTQSIRTPAGLTVSRDLIVHAPAVAILAMTPDQQVLVNREYRVGVNAEAYALPAGLMDDDETAEEAARRELAEETGFVAQTMRELTAVRASEGMTDEVVHLMHATIDVNARTETHFDADEFVTSALVPFDEVVGAVKSGLIASAQSVAAVSYFLAFE